MPGRCCKKKDKNLLLSHVETFKYLHMWIFSTSSAHKTSSPKLFVCAFRSSRTVIIYHVTTHYPFSRHSRCHGRGSRSLWRARLGSGVGERHVFDGTDNHDDASLQRWKQVWQTGWIMNMTGSAATLAIGTGSKCLRHSLLAGALVGGGTLVFSLSSYAAAYHADRTYSKGAPIGGSATILGWLVLGMFP